MSFGKMATLLFGLAGVLALVSFTVLPGAPSLGSFAGGGGHVVTNHAEGEDPSIAANRGLEEARARRAAVPVDFGAVPGNAGAPPSPGFSGDELPPTQDQVPPPPGAAPGQPAVPPPPKVQAAPQVSFVPGQPMVDTNPSR